MKTYLIELPSKTKVSFVEQEQSISTRNLTYFIFWQSLEGED
tara:strand:+ start:239 stop:364 length:126 start_codon:yes stop_codon:yes gene_type:complete